MMMIVANSESVLLYNSASQAAGATKNLTCAVSHREEKKWMNALRIKYYYEEQDDDDDGWCI